MDTSKEYILMCEKAVEIQELWSKMDGDFCHFKDDEDYGTGTGILFDGSVCTSGWHNYHDYWYIPNGSIWLLRQDQLQEILWKTEREGIEKSTDAEVQGYYWDLMLEVFECLEFYDAECYDYDHLKSMEQLWLAFVMKEKFNKIWNGENWIPDNPKE